MAGCFALLVGLQATSNGQQVVERNVSPQSSSKRSDTKFVRQTSFWSSSSARSTPLAAANVRPLPDGIESGVGITGNSPPGAGRPILQAPKPVSRPALTQSAKRPTHVYPSHLQNGGQSSGAANATQFASRNQNVTRPGSPAVHVYPKHLQPQQSTGRKPVRMISSPQQSFRSGAGHSLTLPPMPQADSSGLQMPAMPSTMSGGQSGHSGFGSPNVFEPPPFAVVPQDNLAVPQNFQAPQQFNAPNQMPGPQIEPLQGQPVDDLSWWESKIANPVLRQRQPISMTLEMAIGLALSEAPELQVLHSDWFIRQIEITRRDAAFDWTSFVEAVWNRDSAPVSSTLDGATSRLRSRTANANVGARRLFRDGGEFEISQTLGIRSSNSDFISPNNQGNSRLQFEWTHPLLRGGGEDYNTSPVRIAAIEKDSAFDLFQVGVQDHLLEVATSYWVLVLRRGRFVQAVSSWNRAVEIEKEMSGRVNVDVTPTMLDRAKSEVASRFATSIEAEHDALRAQDALLRLIYGARFVEFVNSEVVTLTMPMKQSSRIDPEPQIQKALRNRSEVHRSIRDIKLAAVRYDVADNEILPVLDMTLTGYVAGLRGNNDIGGAFQNQFTEGEPGVGIGFNYEIPYRNRASEAAVEQAQIGIKRMKAELETTIANVTEDVRAQVIDRNKYGAVLKTQWESLARERRQLKYSQARRELLADGTQVADLYLENALQQQGRLAAAEFTYLQSQIRYAVADTSLLRAISSIDELSNDMSASCGPAAAVRQAAQSRMNFSTESMVPIGHATIDQQAAAEVPVSPVAR